MWRKLAKLVAATGLAWPALAHASCDANNQYSFTFNTATAATLSYSSSYTYTATNALGSSVNVTISWVTNGLTSINVGGANLPAINNLINDSGTNNNLMIGGQFSSRTASITSGVRTITTKLTFATTVRDVSVQLNDIDYGSNQFRDWIYVSGTGPGGTFVPGITTPYTNNNTGGPKSDANSTITLGAATTPYSISANEGVGTASNPNTASNLGTMYATWAQPITSASIIYGNYPLTGTETTTGVQAYGIQTITFCPMPQISVTKTSNVVDDPTNGTTNPKRIPGADVDYTLTVTNSGGSPVDLTSAVLTDVLPSNLTFDYVDFDSTTAGVQPFVFTPNTSGLTFSSSNITYSSDGGTTYAYTPATTGYDSNIKAIKLIPQGTMAANSSFSIKFRTKVN